MTSPYSIHIADHCLQCENHHVLTNLFHWIYPISNRFIVKTGCVPVCFYLSYYLSCHLRNVTWSTDNNKNAKLDRKCVEKIKGNSVI